MIVICAVAVTTARADQSIIWSQQEPNSETNTAAVAMSSDWRTYAFFGADGLIGVAKAPFTRSPEPV